MFEKIITRAFFATLFSALTVAGAHAFDAMHELDLTTAAAKNSAGWLIAHDDSAATSRQQ